MHAVLHWDFGITLKLGTLYNRLGKAAWRLWVLDETRHGLHGFTRRVWGLTGHRPVTAMNQV